MFPQFEIVWLSLYQERTKGYVLPLPLLLPLPCSSHVEIDPSVK